MTRLRLIHWETAEGRSRAASLRAAGLDAVFDPVAGPADLKRIAADPPDVLVVDLSRSPMRGRDFALALRERKAMRAVPLVFADGTPEKVARVRETFPDAVYASWDGIADAVRDALARPPTDGVRRSRMDGYAGTPLAAKLGIKAGGAVALVGAPDGFEALLAPLPEGATARRDLRRAPDLAVWFPRSLAEAEKRFASLGERAGRGGIWVAWPKKTSGVATDLSETLVRRIGLEAGFVDCKVCAIDATWSALRFARRNGKGRG